jgi:hypothetical protein
VCWRRALFVTGLSLLFFLCACQKETQDRFVDSEPAHSAILSFAVYNHTQGFLTKLKKTVEIGDEVTIQISEIGIDGVDEDRIVMREDLFGAFVASSRTGSVTFIAPAEKKEFTVYLMNASNGADYRKVDTYAGRNEGVLEYVPPLLWYRENKNDYRGPSEVIQDAINQLNNALEYSWAKYGSFQNIDQRRNSSFGVGYGLCRNQFGWHSPYWAGVNPEHCLTYKMKLATLIEEIFELITRLNDIGGKDTATLITDPDSGNLNDVGKDLLAYVFVKDEKI